MNIRTIGVMTPGDMGQAIAIQLKSAGFAVATALEGRSERSHRLAREAGLDDLGSIGRLVAQCDLVLSVMNPAAAAGFAAEAARGLEAARARTLIVDCNAVAPQTVHVIGETITRAGGRFVDAGIIGAPPRDGARTTLYVSGPDARRLQVLAGPQVGIHVVSERIGDASALKMCSAALSKGTQALWLQVLTAASRLGIAQALEQEVRAGARAPILDYALTQFRILPPKAYRWVPEMGEIAATLADTGVPPGLFESVGETFAQVARSELARASVEANRSRGLDGAEVVRRLAAADAPRAALESEPDKAASRGEGAKR
jgi:3-hydroxyisobutyrate dehydrogenase-like beta-hydroxyacid dehydrogenase